ncbi:ChaN family lipoprotein [Paludibacterium paludis]|nr:ChaN family lipoprotein [Paludibacterium paludis]
MQWANAQGIWLMGEVHDNAEGHRRRFEELVALIETGARPAIAMEQFDRGSQPALDAAMQRCEEASCVVAAAAEGRTRWAWTHYLPVIDLALKHRLPVLAANLSREEASRVVRAGFAGAFDDALRLRYGLDAPLPEHLLRAQEAAVREGHCGQLPETLVAPMARAQMARDVWMAKVVEDAAVAGDVVLLAGNGHVRRDLGVARWLADPLRRRARTVGFIEPGGVGEFDRRVGIGRAERGDPCAGVIVPAAKGAA